MAKTLLEKRIKDELFGCDGEIRRIRLERGLGLAYAGGEEHGRLVLSREGDKPPSEKEIEIVQKAMGAVAGLAGLRVLGFKALGTVEEAGHAVVRFAVHYGEQLSLL
ncbi:MAG: hypothetical protein HC804_12125 [Anaerolineae bacterium]|nr:hypothetical protein [Anaerolineae bacterium]